MHLNKHSIFGISLDAAGLVALADLSTIAERTALTGSASLLDFLFLAPGIYRQQEAPEINGGELPITAAMTSGYVFRVENPATVRYLQRIGRLGCLVTAEVCRGPENSWRDFGIFYSNRDRNIVSSCLYLTGILLSIAVISILGAIRDFWAFGVLLMLVLARIINTIVIRRRTAGGWKGAPEPGKEDDLLVLLSQDRWLRLRGPVDDLKWVTAGQWLREQETPEGFATAFGTLLVYIAAALAANASTIGSLFVGALLLISVALLGLCNSFTRDLHMFGYLLSVVGEPKSYHRRLDMAAELIEETWEERVNECKKENVPVKGFKGDGAVQMGLVTSDSRSVTRPETESLRAKSVASEAQVAILPAQPNVSASPEANGSRPVSTARPVGAVSV